MTTRLKNTNGLPPAQGLYHPAQEHDACGIGFVANIRGHKSHEIISKGIQVLLNLTHRGACGCDPETGDGAGILLQIPHQFFVRECDKLGFELPQPGAYGVGMTFLPVEKHPRLQCEGILERIAREEGLTVLGWRDTPCFASAIGRVARGSQPYIQQIFLGCGAFTDEDAFERKLYIVRKRAEVKSQHRTLRMPLSSISHRSLAAPSFTRACCSRRRSLISTKSFLILM